MLAAVAMGTIYFGAGNAFWFGILLVFSSHQAFSKLHHDNKAELELTYAKTGRRDAGQVFANGGLGMVFVLLNAIVPMDLWEFLFIGVMATVTSDTWATEIGTLSKKPPRSVLTGKILPAGLIGWRIQPRDASRSRRRCAYWCFLMAAADDIRHAGSILPVAYIGWTRWRTCGRVHGFYSRGNRAADESLHGMRPRSGKYTPLR